MEQVAEEKVFDKQIWLNSFKIFGKIFFCLVVSFFYVISVMFFIQPKFDAKIFNYFGLTKAEESCYEQIYNKSNSSVDLYNLILFEQQIGNTNKELLYINELLAKDDYEEFCDKLDKSSIENAGSNKTLIATVGDVDSFLISRKVKCLYQMNRNTKFENRSKSVQEYVRSCLKNGSLTELSFSTYVLLVDGDSSLSENQKKQEFESLNDLISSANNVSTETLLNDREMQLFETINTSSSNAENIIVLNAMVKFYRAKYVFCEKLGESADVLESIESKYDSAVRGYLELIN